MKKLAILAGTALLACCTAQQVADVVACAQVVQGVVAADAGKTPQQIAFDAGTAAGTNAACSGLLVTVTNGVATVTNPAKPGATASAKMPQ